MSGSGQPIGAVADQRALQKRFGGCVDRAEQILLQGFPRIRHRGGVAGLGVDICARAGANALDELLMKGFDLGAEPLIALAMRTE